MTYAIFDNYIQKDKSDSFLLAAKKLLEEFNISYTMLQGFQVDAASEGKALNEEAFYKNHIINLSAAKSSSCDILCIDDSSYVSLMHTKEALLEDKELLGRVAALVDVPIALDVNIVHVNELIRDTIGFMSLQSKIKHPFSEFNAAIFEGNKVEHSNANHAILTLLGANIISFDEYESSDGFEILESNSPLAFALAGRVMLDAFDNAADFVVTNDTRSFAMFDHYQKNLEKSVGREIGLSVFTTPQLILMALGCVDKSELGLDKHAVKATLI